MTRTVIPANDSANNDTIYSERIYQPQFIDKNGQPVDGMRAGYGENTAGVYHWDGQGRTQDEDYQNLRNKFNKAKLLNTRKIPFTNNLADKYRGFSYTE